jgi:hypothetical protein
MTMTDPHISVRIEQLERANRLWKRLALGALTALLLIVATAIALVIVRSHQVQVEQDRAEQALREVERQRDAARELAEQNAKQEAEAKNQLQRALYAEQIARAQAAWDAENARREKNP